MNRIELYLICWKQRFFPPIGKPRIAYCQCLIFDRNNNADLAIISSKSFIYSLFSVASVFLCNGTHLAYRASGKIWLATAIFFFLGATAEVRYGMICVTEEQSLY